MRERLRRHPEMKEVNLFEGVSSRLNLKVWAGEVGGWISDYFEEILARHRIHNEAARVQNELDWE